MGVRSVCKDVMAVREGRERRRGREKKRTCAVNKCGRHWETGHVYECVGAGR